MTDGNGTTAFTYDDWGRMTGKSRGGLSATYGYDYGGKLVSVDSDFPDEGSVAYDYGGDGKWRLRTAGTAGTWYNWAGWHVIQEEDDAAGDGDLARTYVGRALAQIDGTDPATGTARYFLHDHLGSTREIRTAGKALDGQFDYTPYGTAFHASHADATTRRFTGHDFDPASGLYFAPFRHYAPGLARWTTRDPLGMVDGPNVYAYVGGNPVSHYDLFGLWNVATSWLNPTCWLPKWTGLRADCEERKGKWTTLNCSRSWNNAARRLYGVFETVHGRDAGMALTTYVMPTAQGEALSMAAMSPQLGRLLMDFDSSIKDRFLIRVEELYGTTMKYKILDDCLRRGFLIHQQYPDAMFDLL